MIFLTFLVFVGLILCINSDCTSNLCADFASNKPPHLVGLDSQKRLHLYDEHFCGYTVPLEKLNVSSQILDLREAQLQLLSYKLIGDRSHFSSSNVLNLWMSSNEMTSRKTTFATLKMPNNQEKTVFQYELQSDAMHPFCKYSPHYNPSYFADYGALAKEIPNRNTDEPDILFSTIQADTNYGVSTSRFDEGCLIASKADDRNYFRRILNKIDLSSKCIFRGEQVYRGFTIDNETSFIWSSGQKVSKGGNEDDNGTQLMVTTLRLVPLSNEKLIQKSFMKLEVLSRKSVSAFFKCSPPPTPVLWIVLLVIFFILMVLSGALGYVSFLRSDQLKKRRYKTLKNEFTATNAKLGSFRRRQSTDSLEVVKENINNDTNDTNDTSSSTLSLSSSSSSSSYTTATSQIIK